MFEGVVLYAGVDRQGTEEYRVTKAQWLEATAEDLKALTVNLHLYPNQSYSMETEPYTGDVILRIKHKIPSITTLA